MNVQQEMRSAEEKMKVNRKHGARSAWQERQRWDSNGLHQTRQGRKINAESGTIINGTG